MERERVAVTARRLVSDSYSSPDSYEAINIVNSYGVFNRAIQSFGVSGLSGSVANAPEPGTVSVSSDSTAITNKIRIPSSPKTSNTFSEKYYVAVKPGVASTDVTMAAAVSGLVNMSVRAAGVVTSTDAANAPFSGQDASISTTIAGKLGDVTYLPIAAVSYNHAVSVTSDSQQSSDVTYAKLTSGGGYEGYNKYVSGVYLSKDTDQLAVTGLGTVIADSDLATIRTTDSALVENYSIEDSSGIESMMIVYGDGYPTRISYLTGENQTDLATGSACSAATMQLSGTLHLTTGDGPLGHNASVLVSGADSGITTLALNGTGNGGYIQNVRIAYAGPNRPGGFGNLYLGYDEYGTPINGGYIGNIYVSSSNTAHIGTLNAANSSSVLQINNNKGNLNVIHGTSGQGNVTVKPYGATASVQVIKNGAFYPFVDVSSASTLAGYLVAANKGIYFKYTGTSIATSGNYRFVPGNIYTYEA